MSLHLLPKPILLSLSQLHSSPHHLPPFLVFQGFPRVATWQLDVGRGVPFGVAISIATFRDPVKVLLTLFSLPSIATRSILAYDLFANCGEFS